MQKKKAFMVETRGEPTRIYEDADTLFRESVRMFGPLTESSRELAAQLVEGRQSIDMGKCLTHEATYGEMLPEAPHAKRAVVVFEVEANYK